MPKQYRQQITRPFLEPLVVKFRERIAQWAHESGATRKLLDAEREKGTVPWKIVRYERVLHPETEPLPLIGRDYVTPETLREHCKYFANECTVVPVAELIDRFKNGRVPQDRSVALTFDGGWIEHFSAVAPILEEFSLPATFFLPTAFIGTSNIYWHDKILYGFLFLRAKGESFPLFNSLPEHAQRELLAISGGSNEISLERALLILDLLRLLPPQERLRFFIEFGELLERHEGLPIIRAHLSWEEAQELSRRGFELGSLTHSHRLLSESSLTELTADLKFSFESLRANGLTSSTALAIPESVLPLEAAEHLETLGFRFVLGVEGRIAIAPSGVRRIPRVSLSQENAATQHLLDCRLWNYQLFGYRIA